MVQVYQWWRRCTLKGIWQAFYACLKDFLLHCASLDNQVDCVNFIDFSSHLYQNKFEHGARIDFDAETVGFEPTKPKRARA